MGLLELFTNKEKTKKEEVEISAPAFSVTKVVSGLGLLVGGLIVAVPKSVKEHDAVVVAVIAAAAAIMLGIFALVAIDIRTRQRAQEAKRRWPNGSDAPAKPDAKEPSEVHLQELTIQVAGNGQETPKQPNPATAVSSKGARVIEVEPGQRVSLVVSDGSGST